VEAKGFKIEEFKSHVSFYLFTFWFFIL